MSDNQNNSNIPLPEIRQYSKEEEEESVATFVSENNFGKQLRQRSKKIQREQVEGSVIEYVPSISPKVSLNSVSEIKEIAQQEENLRSGNSLVENGMEEELQQKLGQTQLQTNPDQLSQEQLPDSNQQNCNQQEIPLVNEDVVIQQQQDFLSDSSQSILLSQQQQSSGQSILGASDRGTTSAHGSILSGITNMTSLSSSRVRIICETGGELAMQISGKLDYVGGERRLVSVEMLASLEYLKTAIEKQLDLQGLLDENQLKAFLPGSDNMLLDIKNDMDLANLWEDLMEYKSNVDPVYRLRLFVCPAESLTEGDDTAYNRSSSIGSPTNTGPPSEQQPSSQKKEVSFSELEAKLEIIQPDEVSVRRLLGAGAQGEVYLGTWQDSDVAVKCLNMSIWADSMYQEGGVSEDAVRELVQEAAILGKLRHPNILSIYGIVIPCADDSCTVEREHDDAVEIALDAAKEVAAAITETNNVQALIVRPPAIVEEFMGGGSLFASLKKRSEFLFGKQGVQIRLKLARDAAKGMEYLHSKKIVHFDLKSANLLLSKRDGKPYCKVADFSLSKQRNNTYVSNVSSQRGTLPWIAPEIIHTPNAVNEKVDVYSFGVVLWELWTGLEPFAGLNYHTLYHKLSSNRDARPAFPGDDDWEGDLIEEPIPGYKQLIQECWATAPADRPTFKEIITKLEELLLQYLAPMQQ